MNPPSLIYTITCPFPLAWLSLFCCTHYSFGRRILKCTILNCYVDDFELFYEIQVENVNHDVLTEMKKRLS